MFGLNVAVKYASAVTKNLCNYLERLQTFKLKRCAPQKIWHVISEVIDLCKITSANTNPVKLKKDVSYSIYGFSCRNVINNIYLPRRKKLNKLWKSVKENQKNQSWWIILETCKCLQQVSASEVFKWIITRSFQVWEVAYF